MKRTEQQTRVSKHSRKPIYAAVALMVILIPAIYFYSASLSQPAEAKAAIIDQLGSSKLDDLIRDENQTFIESASELLYKRFSIVDYYSDNATVEEYSKLASAGYKLILWRAHSALDLNSKYIAMSTTDKYGSISYDQYPDGSLTLVNITGDPTLYFGITPTFIEKVMSGTFQDTVIVLMSCNGLQQGYLKTAQAFEAKGARVIISWDNWVSTSDNDYAASLLLQHLIDENNTVSAAVGKLWPFPSEFGWARLVYDPVSAGNYLIPDYRKNDSTNTALMIVPVSEKVEDPRGNRF
ncbi:MAG: hypothetical protein ABSD73_05315 [Candidatus Bathyarchaeia archaeon]